MSKKHVATAKLLEAFGNAVGTVTRESNRPVWKIKEVTVGQARNILNEFIQALHEGISELYIDHKLIDASDFEDTLPQYNAESTVSFDARFNVNDQFFTDFAHCKEYYVNTAAKFDDFFVFNPPTQVDSLQNSPQEWQQFRANYDAADSLLLQLNELAHHNGSSEAIFVDPSANSMSSIAVATKLASLYGSDSSILDTACQATFISNLLVDIEAKNTNYLKEQSVFRSSIFEFFETHSGKSDPIKAGIFLLKNIVSLEAIYAQNFQAYISGLSLKQLKTDLAAEQLKLSDQASKGLMDISGKMFALPAAVGLTKFSTEAGTTFGYIVIALTCLILLLPLLSQRRQLNNIKCSNAIAFGDLDKKIQQVNDSDTKTDLENIRKNLAKTVRSVNRTLDFYIILALLPLLYICVPNSWLVSIQSAAPQWTAAIMHQASELLIQAKKYL